MRIMFRVCELKTLIIRYHRILHSSEGEHINVYGC